MKNIIRRVGPAPLAVAALAGALMAATAPSAPAQDNPPAEPPVVIRPTTPARILVNGKPVGADQPPVLVRQAGELGAHVLVPIRFVVESLGATIYWDPEAQTAIVLRGGDNITLRPGAETASVNGVNLAVATPVQLIGGRTMVPLRFVSNALGATVTWDAAARTVAVSLPPVGGAGRAPSSDTLAKVPADQGTVPASKPD